MLSPVMIERPPGHILMRTLDVLALMFTEPFIFKNQHQDVQSQEKHMSVLLESESSLCVPLPPIIKL